MKTFPQWLPLQAAADRWLRRRQVLPAAQVKSNLCLSPLYPAHTHLAFNFLKLPQTILFFLIPQHNPPVELRHIILRKYEKKYSSTKTWHNIEGNPNSLDLNLYCKLLYSGYLLHCFSFLKMKNFQNKVQAHGCLYTTVVGRYLKTTLTITLIPIARKGVHLSFNHFDSIM